MVADILLNDVKDVINQKSSRSSKNSKKEKKIDPKKSDSSKKKLAK